MLRRRQLVRNGPVASRYQGARRIRVSPVESEMTIEKAREDLRLNCRRLPLKGQPEGKTQPGAEVFSSLPLDPLRRSILTLHRINPRPLVTVGGTAVGVPS